MLQCPFLKNRTSHQFLALPRHHLFTHSIYSFLPADNDLEMAHACRHAFIPAVTSASMAQAIEDDKDSFTVTEDKGIGLVETGATEEALESVLEMLRPRP